MNGYSGGTSIQQGTIASGGRGLGRGTVDVASGATLDITGVGGLAGQFYQYPAAIGNFQSLLTLDDLVGKLPMRVPWELTTPYSLSIMWRTDVPEAAYLSGKIVIPTPGTYTFALLATQFARMWIDGTEVVSDNNVSEYQYGSLKLGTGRHDIVVGYFNSPGNPSQLQAYMSGADNRTFVRIGGGNGTTPDLMIDSLTGAGAVALTTGNLIVGFDNTSTTFRGTISGAGGVHKVGSGVLTLTGSNTYMDSTTVAGGNIALSANAALGGTAVTVVPGAVLSAIPGNGNAWIGNPDAEVPATALTLTAGSTYSMADGAIGSCNLSPNTWFGSALATSGATLDFDLSSSGADLLACTGWSTVNGTNTIAITCLGDGLTIGGSYTIIHAFGGLDGGAWRFPNGKTTMPVTVGRGSYELMLSSGPFAVMVTVKPPPPMRAPVGVSLEASPLRSLTDEAGELFATREPDAMRSRDLARKSASGQRGFRQSVVALP